MAGEENRSRQAAGATRTTSTTTEADGAKAATTTEADGVTSGGVLVLYTGGTVGAVHRHDGNRASPLVPGSAAELERHLPFVSGQCIRFGAELVPVTVVATEELLDSTNITPTDWQTIARHVEAAYDDYAGFVILHGTDTMAYTASALSFMFENLAKPVILTGAQRPIGETRSDALQNILTAIEIAAAPLLGRTVVPEVCVFFHDLLLRGCRVTKTSASAYGGFHTPNLPPLGVVGEHIRIDETLLRPPASQPFRVHYALERRIAILQLSPLMSTDMLDRMLSLPSLQAAILETYGVGNAPSDPAFLAAIGDAVARGVKVVAVTQCRQGAVELGLYQVSAGLLSRGVISGLDMTAEAAQAKMAVLLADDEMSPHVEGLMQMSLRGEMSQSLVDLDFPAATASPAAAVTQCNSAPTVGEVAALSIVSAQLRLLDFAIDAAEATSIPVRISIDGYLPLETLSELQAPPVSRVQYLDWDPSDSSPIAIIDVSDFFRGHRLPTAPLTIRLAVEESHTMSWHALELGLFIEGTAPSVQ